MQFLSTIFVHLYASSSYNLFVQYEIVMKENRCSLSWWLLVCFNLVIIHYSSITHALLFFRAHLGDCNDLVMDHHFGLNQNIWPCQSDIHIMMMMNAHPFLQLNIVMGHQTLNAKDEKHGIINHHPNSKIGSQ